MNTELECKVWIDYDFSNIGNGISINGVWLEATPSSPPSIEITEYLDEATMAQAVNMVEWELQKEHERKAALEEDAADSRYQLWREDQAMAEDAAESRRDD